MCMSGNLDPFTSMHLSGRRLGLFVAASDNRVIPVGPAGSGSRRSCVPRGCFIRCWSPLCHQGDD
ncbi:hypothetical protein E2562_005870 [Oryza meyeriana var. granulata]|uniref:Uncharacterized protein n=1 Tax=Oryza meyeriana var. granulata TaxID=110450 RepID=A0A6G1DV21_9ORYZ|nr:hypothetical protein E2562_005870 [Oryza meyeriana var. granulata]